MFRAESALNATYLVVVIGGTATTTWVTLWATMIRPRARQRREQEETERKRQEERNLILDGIPATAVSAGVPDLAVRMKAVESSVLQLARRVNETNGTGRRSESKIDLLLSYFPDIKVPAHLAKDYDPGQYHPQEAS